MAWTPVILVTLIAVGSAIWANLAYTVTDTADYQYFPPFQPHSNFNMNHHLGAENFNIALSLRAGEGFAHPFAEKTGPTAWMPPILPVVLATLLWVCDDDKDTVMTIVIGLQVAVLIGTGLLVLALAGRTTKHLWATAAALLFIVGFFVDFFLWFQLVHDSWFVLLALDIMLAGFCWYRPLSSNGRGASWGLFGGLSALVNPVVGFTWGLVTLFLALRRRAWGPLVVAGTCAVLAVTPWLVRNYIVFGAWIPVKSNLAYELWQSQCLESDGLVHLATFASHPYTAPGTERTAHKELGEIAFMEHKGEMFRQAVQANPQEFAERVVSRFVAATIWYESFWPGEEVLLPYWVVIRRVVHPLPMLSLVFLIVTSWWRPLPTIHWLVISLYSVYLLPFIAISYYDRYAVPLLAAKVLLTIWAADRMLSWLLEGKVAVNKENATWRLSQIRKAAEVPVKV